MDKNIKKYVVFTDLADYTLKSSLLTPKQLKEFIIDKQDKLILPLIKKYNWKLVKYIWDSYLILFDTLINSVQFAIKLQKELRKYNKDIKFNLKKIELKIVINYWKLLEKNTSIWKEYFWDVINISSRILEKSSKNRIIVTQIIYDLLKQKKYDINIEKIWDFIFKWVIYKVSLYEIIYDKRFKKAEIEDKILNEKIKKIKEIDKVIFNVSSVAFLLTIQPLPLLDRYFIVLLHLYLLREIALKYGINLSVKESKEILTTILLSIWWIYWTNQLLTSLWKIGLPFVWWYLFAPTNFALTYWLWKVFSNYFYYKEEKVKLTNENIKDIFLWTREKWLSIAKSQKTTIIVTWKKYKDKIFDKIDELKKIYQDLKDFYIKKMKK